MLKKASLIIALTLLSITGSTAAGEPASPDFDILTDIGSQSISLTRDRDGFIWIGTLLDGAYRYDGKTLKHYGRASGLVSGNAISCIMEDREGVLWFAVSGGGLCGYDKETNRSTCYSHDKRKPESLSENAFYWSGKQILCQDKAGFIWVGTIGGGLNRFDKKTDAFTHFKHDPHNVNSLGNDNVRAVMEDREGALWVGTEKGLNRLDPSRARITRFLPEPGNPESISGEIVTSMFEDGDGMLWFGTESAGLNRLDAATGTFKRYRHTPNDPRTLGSDRVTFIFEEPKGVLWLSHELRLTLFNKRDETFSPYTGSMPDITAALREQDTGRIWALFDNGKLGKRDGVGAKFRLYRHDPADSNSLPSDIVVTIYEDRAGVPWISCLGGFARLDPDTGVFTSYMHEPGNPESIPSTIDYTPGVFEDAEGTFWLGNAMPASISIFDRETGKIVKDYKHDPDDPDSMPDATQVNAFFQDRDDPSILWMATAKGLARFDKRTETFRSITRCDSWNIHEDRRGFIWLTTWGAGLLRYNKHTGEETYFKTDPDRPESISGNIALPLRITRDGRFWVGTDNGLDLFDPESGRFTRHRREDGYPWDSVHSIGEDDRGLLWLGTNAGLARFDPATKQARTYTREDGIQGDMFYPLNGIRTRDGRMWFGGPKGMNSFHPGKIGDNPDPPPIRLTSIKQGGEEVDFGKAPERLEEITLDWRSNYFEFEFVAMDHANPGKNQYSYKLEGLDNDWYLAGTRNFGRYPGIPPGEYILRLRGSNNDGVWNNEGRSLLVHVAPPFWRTAWFYGLILFLAAGVIAAVIFYLVELRRQIKERRRAEGRLQESLASVERLNVDLKRLDQLKDEFMANTSHELRTPLNGIIGLAEALLEGPGSGMPASSCNDLRMIVSSGRRLANLVNDILDFSKLRHKDLVLRKRAVDVRAVVELVLALLRSLSDGKNLTLENKVPRNAPPAAADEDRLQQILFNLAGNAVKFTERGGVSIGAEVLPDGLEIWVEDTGIGIPEDKQERIFESFEQVDGAVSRRYGGTGLGLAVSKQLVELHGGRIRVASRPGAGSTFSFSLPLAAEELVEAAGTPTGRTKDPGGRELVTGMVASDTVSPGEEEAPESSHPAPDETAPRILIVDDEPVNLRVIRNHLSARGYQVVQASSGREALGLIEAGKPFDLVILDVMMPSMTGYEVCRRLRERYTRGELPVVMLSAKNRVEDLVVGLRAGANDYQAKPFSRAELLARVKTHLSVKESTDEVRRTRDEMRYLRDYLSGVINSMPSALVSVDGNAAVTQWNREAEPFTEEGAPLAAGVIFAEAFPKFTRVGDAIAHVVKRGRTETLEKMKVAQKGETRFYDITVYPLSVGDEPGAVARIDDVTDRVRIEEMMVQSEKMLSVGGLAAGMAHEINNPLSGILQTIQVVHRRLDEGFSKNREVAEEVGAGMEAVRRYISARGIDGMLSRIKSAGEQAAKIVENMLSFSRKSDASFAPHNLAELLDKTALLAEHEYDLKKKFDFRTIEIVREYAEDLPPAHCDRVKVQQVFFNLLKNGAQAMAGNGSDRGAGDGAPKAEKPRFILRTRRSGDNVVVEIEDNGPGMDEETRRRVFEPFFTTKALGVGTGLGLSVSYFIITEDHGGAMRVESAPGRGARFTVEIPMWSPTGPVKGR